MHRISTGETLWTIARAYDLRVVDILNANDMDERRAASIRAGAELKIPGVSEARQVHLPSGELVSETTEETGSRPKGVMHTLRRGETLWDMARTFSVPVAEIMAANRLGPDDVSSLKEGRELLVPGVERDIKGEVKKRLSKRESKIRSRAKRVADRLGLGTRRAASRLLTGDLEEAWTRAAAKRIDRFPGTLRWPVTNGWFVRGYGSGKDGYHLAVDIAGETGWNVRSCAAGIVGYSGDGVKGYGNIVMVIHAGGWVTIYAHNSVNFVVAGQKVRRGEILAELGNTGISRGPHVHFEFIYDHKNCDPAVLFRPGIKRKDGEVQKISYTSWKRPGHKPKWVKCAPRRNYPHGKSVSNEGIED